MEKIKSIRKKEVGKTKMCPKCGENVDERATICLNCGSLLTRKDNIQEQHSRGYESSKNKGYIKLIIFSILAIGIVSAGTVIWVFIWPGPSLKKIPIDGYVFRPEESVVIGQVSKKLCSPEEFGAAIQKSPLQGPAVGMEVRIAGQDSPILTNLTNQNGRFSLSARRYKLKDSFITLSDEASGQIVKYPISYSDESANSSENIMHVININQNGTVDVFYLINYILFIEHGETSVFQLKR